MCKDCPWILFITCTTLLGVHLSVALDSNDVRGALQGADGVLGEFDTAAQYVKGEMIHWRSSYRKPGAIPSRLNVSRTFPPWSLTCFEALIILVYESAEADIGIKAGFVR